MRNRGGGECLTRGEVNASAETVRGAKAGDFAQCGFKTLLQFLPCWHRARTAILVGPCSIVGGDLLNSNFLPARVNS